MAPDPKRHRGQPRGVEVQQIHISTPTLPELQAEAELGATEFNSQEIPGMDVFTLSDGLPVLVLAGPGQL